MRKIISTLKIELYILSIIWFVLPLSLGTTVDFALLGFLHLPSILGFTFYVAAFLTVAGPFVSIAWALLMLRKYSLPLNRDFFAFTLVTIALTSALSGINLQLFARFAT